MKVLIIEDDPMVEFIHRNYLEKVGWFQEIYSANGVELAQHLLKEKKVDLILLDIHLKNGNGLEFLKELREKGQAVDVIIISAANERQTVETGLAAGVLDYLIKPFTFQRFQQSMALFHTKSAQLQGEKIQQENIDRLIYQKQAPVFQKEQVMEEKGLTLETIALIRQVIKKLPQPFNIQDVVEKSGLSHVSVRKYIAYLEENGELTSHRVYLAVGRPYKVYRLKEELT